MEFDRFLLVIITGAHMWGMNKCMILTFFLSPVSLFYPVPSYRNLNYQLTDHFVYDWLGDLFWVLGIRAGRSYYPELPPGSKEPMIYIER